MEILARTVEANRCYGPVTALDGVSLDVPAGQLLGLLPSVRVVYVGRRRGADHPVEAVV